MDINCFGLLKWTLSELSLDLGKIKWAVNVMVMHRVGTEVRFT